MDLCHTGDYQTEYLRHAPCMRRAQTEYENCADEYQLRIKTLNKVSRHYTTVSCTGVQYRRE